MSNFDLKTQELGAREEAQHLLQGRFAAGGVADAIAAASKNAGYPAVVRS